jgi:hypothetical protein
MNQWRYQMQQIERALNLANVTKNEFDMWQIEVKDGFNLRNCHAIPEIMAKVGRKHLSEIPQQWSLKQFLVKSEMREKSLLDEVHSLKSEMQSLKRKLNEMEKREAEHMACSKRIEQLLMNNVLTNESAGNVAVENVIEEAIASSDRYSKNDFTAYEEVRLKLSEHSNDIEELVFCYFDNHAEQVYGEFRDKKSSCRQSWMRIKNAVRCIVALIEDKTSMKRPPISDGISVYNTWRGNIKDKIKLSSTKLISLLQRHGILSINEKPTVNSITKKKKLIDSLFLDQLGIDLKTFSIDTN